MIKQLMIIAVLAVVLMFDMSAMASEGYELLFQGSTSRLSKKEKQLIFNELDFRVSNDRKVIIDETCEQDISPTVKIDDLNGDGVEEVFVIWGNSCTSGQAGTTVSLLIKDKSGKYKNNLNIPANGYEKLLTINHGFPDIKLGGPGFCHGIWRWDGKKYEHFRNESEIQGGCDGVEK